MKYTRESFIESNLYYIVECNDYAQLSAFIPAILHFKPVDFKPVNMTVFIPNKDIPKFKNLQEQLLWYEPEINKLLKENT